MAYVDDAQFKQFRLWQARQEMQAAADAAKAKQERERRERQEDYLRDRAIDKALMDGISKGQTWGQFVAATAAPDSLKERFLTLEAQHRQEPPEDAFKKGFYACDQ